MANQNRHARPELLCPAGDFESLRAAAANGADAVYLGLQGFNARMRAENFSQSDLIRAVEYLHDRNVRCYVAMNTLLFADELSRAGDFVMTVASSGADAIIVQDIGLAAMIREIAPTLPIHASTQMTLCNRDAIAMAGRLGIKRVILPRELSIDKIKSLAMEGLMELEVFVHGAICISYSGQCLASLSMSERSANRGLCAQPCRLPYRLVVDDKPLDMYERRYPLCPTDLATFDIVGELINAGVAALKIEGRMKSPHYVAVATQTYRRAIDAAIAGERFNLDAAGKLELMQGFSRGFSHGFLDGEDNQRLVHGRYPQNVGAMVGTVTGKTASGIIVQLSEEVAGVIRIKPGDGIMIQGSRAEDRIGGRVYQVFARDPRFTGGHIRLELRFGRDDLDLATVQEGGTVWRTDDPQFRRELWQSWNRDLPSRRVALDFELSAVVGEKMKLKVSDELGNSAEAQSDQSLVAATKHPATLEMIRQQLDRLNDTPYSLGEVRLLDAAGSFVQTSPAMVPKSILNDLRRHVVDSLISRRKSSAIHAIVSADALNTIRNGLLSDRQANADDAVRLHVLVRQPEQIGAVIEWRKSCGAISSDSLAYCDLSRIEQYLQAAEQLSAAGITAAAVLPRITLDDDRQTVDEIVGLETGAILARNLGQLEMLAAMESRRRILADYTLNAANDLSFSQLRRMGAERIAVSLDPKWEEFSPAIRYITPGSIESVISLKVPMFHMEHCLLAANLTDAPGHPKCGKPCRSKQMFVQDRMGQMNPVRTDATWRNTVFNARRIQASSADMSAMAVAGIRDFRVELLDESAEQSLDLLRAISAMLLQHCGR